MEFFKDFANIFTWQGFLHSLTISKVLSVIAIVILFFLLCISVVKFFQGDSVSSALINSTDALKSKYFWIFTIIVSVIILVVWHYLTVKLQNLDSNWFVDFLLSGDK